MLCIGFPAQISSFNLDITQKYLPLFLRCNGRKSYVFSQPGTPPFQPDRRTNKSVNTDLARAFLSRKFMHKERSDPELSPKKKTPKSNPKHGNYLSPFTGTHAHQDAEAGARVSCGLGSSSAAQVEGEAIPLAALSGKLFLYHYYRGNMHMNMDLPRSPV